MGSEEIPAIDFRQVHDGGLEPGTMEWRELTDQVSRACQTHGIFRVIYDHRPGELCKDIIAVAKEAFELPLETKNKIKGSKPHFGYRGIDPLFTLSESMTVEGEPEVIQALVEQLWPEGNPKALETLKSFYGQLAKLDMILRHMILEALGVGHLYESLVNNTQAYSSFVRYVPPSQNESSTALRPHTDIHFIAMIFQDDTGGLEYYTKDGSWIPLQQLPNSFIVFIGDSFKAWSNDRLEHPRHRVVVNKGKDRLSFIYFVIPKDGVPIEAPEELVDSEHQRVFRPFDYMDYLEYTFRTVETVKPALYAFAGI